MPDRRLLRLLLVLLPLWLPGFLAAVGRCLLRQDAESRDRYVETVLDYDEWRRLAREEGWPLTDMLAEARRRGASSVAVTEDTLASLEAEGRVALLTYPEVLKLSLETFVASPTPQLAESPGTLWVHARNEDLLDRIEHLLSWKLPTGRVQRLHRHLLLVRKSSREFRERVGLGFSRRDLDLIAGQGLGVVLRVFNHPGLDDRALQQIIRGFPDPASVSALLFAEDEILGNRGELPTAIQELSDRAYRIAQIELTEQEGMDALLARIQGKRPVVRVHGISRRELDEIYSPGRAVARFERAVRDRRLKMLYIRCFFQDGKKYLDDLVHFNMNYLSDIVQGLTDMGFAIPRTDDERRQEPRHLVGGLSRGERLAIGLALLLGLPLGVALVRGRAPLARDVFLTASAAVVLWLLLPAGQFTVWTGLAGAVIWSLLGPLWAIRRLEAEPEPATAIAPFGSAVRFLVRLALPGFVGGTLIAGLHAEVPYLLHFLQFRGVKAAFVLPLLFILVWSFRRYGGGAFSLLSRPLTLREAGLIAVVLAASALYLVRSGNVTFLKPSATEDLARTFLENLLVARPRNKEFLVGYPAALFFLLFWFRRAREILPVLAVFLVMGQVSVVNTFCHFHSPLYLAYLRGFHGWWLGILTGLVALAGYVLLTLLVALGRKERNVLLVGYFGFGNLGDEILWRTFVTEGERVRPDLSWLVLHRTGRGDALPADTRMVPRHSPLALLEALAGARAVAIPGGGVLQASTSLASLLYYCGLLFCGRLAGARLLLPAQGLGPWEARRGAEGPSMPANLAAMLVRMLIDDADYLSVRDAESLAEARRLPGPPREPERTTDLAFLLPAPGAAGIPAAGIPAAGIPAAGIPAAGIPAAGIPAAGASVANGPVENDPAANGPAAAGMPLLRVAGTGGVARDRLQLGVILRGSAARAGEVAARLVETAARLENLDLRPLAFQAGEDEAPWAATPLAGQVQVLADPAAALKALDGLDILLSMRLHGCLLATVAGTPWIGVEVDPKIRGLAQECDWPHVISPAEALDGDRLTRRLDDLMQARDEARTRLLAVAEAKRQVARADVSDCLARIPPPLA
ncbi:MAG: hypothetical protein GX442_09315 [Candidatus Riflebacteria bacterium]|nr:hypothetical protein [Candidatus Riflebacteria bacterium]